MPNSSITSFFLSFSFLGRGGPGHTKQKRMEIPVPWINLREPKLPFRTPGRSQLQPWPAPSNKNQNTKNQQTQLPKEWVNCIKSIKSLTWNTKIPSLMVGLPKTLLTLNAELPYNRAQTFAANSSFTCKNDVPLQHQTSKTQELKKATKSELGTHYCGWFVKALEGEGATGKGP